MKISFFSFLFFLMVNLLGGSPLQARVFRMNDETVAVYFGGSYGPSLLKQTHFEGTSGSGATIDKSVLTNYSGEFGVLFRSPKVGLRLGVELIKPGDLTEAVGSDASGVKLYDFESQISALVPKLALEFNIKGTDIWRAFFSLAAGSATVTYKNSYALTAEGQTAYSGVADFSEEGVGTALLYEGGVGIEALMNDTTTIALSLGYRKMDVLKYKYKTAVSTFSGPVVAKEAVVNEDGSSKASIFSGVAGSVLFRFYLGK